MTAGDPLIVLLRHEGPTVLLGVILLATGLGAIMLSLLRGRRRDLTLPSFGIFCSLYGLRLLSGAHTIHLLLGAPFQWRYLGAFITYVIPIPATVFFIQFLGRGRRSRLYILLGVQVTFAVVAILSDSMRGRAFTMDRPNHVLALAWGIVVLADLFRRDLKATRELRVLRAGFLIFALFVVAENLRGLGIFRWPQNFEVLGFVAFVGTLAYVAARRFFDNEKQLLAIHGELETARRIQNSILPRDMPSIQGLQITARFVPMASVAGDLYDFLQLDNNRLAILVADVSGHGVPAALIASMVKVAFASQWAHTCDPASILDGMNHVFCGKFEHEYITAACLLLDTASGTVLHSSAGHPPALVSRKGDGKLRVLEESGLILGQFPRARYSTISLELRPGDRIVLYTDGIAEATNARGEFFGDGALTGFIQSHAALPANRFADSLLEQLKAWSGKAEGAPTEDDLTLVVVDVEEKMGASSGSP